MDYLDRLESAKKSFKIADHMLTITHNVVNDPKLLLLVIQRLFNVYESLIASVLEYDLYFHRIPPYHESFDEMFNIFKVRCTRRYSLSSSYIELINEVHGILNQQKKGPVSFSRKGSYVICSDKYETKVLTPESIKGYVEKTKLFIRDTEHMITKEVGA